MSSIEEVPKNCKCLEIINENNSKKLSTIILPDSIEVIVCTERYKFINELPEILPSSLKYLACYTNNLKYLPNLPSLLEFLECYENPLIEIPELPENLYMLHSYSTYIKEYPSLPSKLINFSCGNDSMTNPDESEIISQVQQLPSYLPKTLEIFECDYNNLTELPELTDKLYLFNCRNNPIKFISHYNYEIIKNMYVKFGIYIKSSTVCGININNTLFYPYGNDYNYCEFFEFSDSDIELFAKNTKIMISEDISTCNMWDITDIMWSNP